MAIYFPLFFVLLQSNFLRKYFSYVVTRSDFINLSAFAWLIFFQFHHEALLSVALEHGLVTFITLCISKLGAGSKLKHYIKFIFWSEQNNNKFKNAPNNWIS